MYALLSISHVGLTEGKIRSAIAHLGRPESCLGGGLGKGAGPLGGLLGAVCATSRGRCARSAEIPLPPFLMLHQPCPGPLHRRRFSPPQTSHCPPSPQSRPPNCSSSASRSCARKPSGPTTPSAPQAQRRPAAPQCEGLHATCPGGQDSGPRMTRRPGAEAQHPPPPPHVWASFGLRVWASPADVEWLARLVAIDLLRGWSGALLCSTDAAATLFRFSCSSR